MVRHHRRTVPTVTQVTQTECGMCSCLGIFGFYGRHESVIDLRAEYEAGRDGLSAGTLVEILRSRGMSTRVFRLANVDALAAFRRPVILFWEDYHFLVLERMTRRGAILMDPASGRRRISRQELGAGFSGIVIAPQPTPVFERVRARPFAEWRSIQLLPGAAKVPLLLSGLLILAGYLVTVVLPLLTQAVVDTMTPRTQALDLRSLAVALPAVVVLFYLVQLSRSVVLAKTVSLVGTHLMSGIFTHLLRLPYSYFSTRPTSELLYRLSSVNAVRDAISTRLIQAALDVGTTICLLVYLAVVSGPIALIAAVIYGTCVATLTLAHNRVTGHLDTEIGFIAKSQGVQLDAISSMSAIKMGGLYESVCEKWGAEFSQSIKSMSKRLTLQQGVIGGLVGGIQLFAPLLLLTVGLHHVQLGTMSMGQAVAVQGIAAVFFGMAASIYNAYSEFVLASRTMLRIRDITETDVEHSAGHIGALDDVRIELRDVGFSYTRNSRPILDGVSMEVPSGSTVAIVGPSGSGKSTLAKLLCTLYQPTSGSVLIGGRDVTEYDLDALRGQIGYVPQDIELHTGTLLDNLAPGQKLQPGVVEDFCRETGLVDFIEELPMGYKTIVSSQGTNFSGGQRQRLAIVRTLLRAPRIMVMDEATSALDTVNETRVTRLLAERGCTQVVFAHRLSTIQNADMIYVLADGRLAQQGTHEELIAVDGAYRVLYEHDAPFGSEVVHA